jgi:hypothetical protein
MTERAFEGLMVALVPLLAHAGTGRLDALATASAGLLSNEHVAVALSTGADLVALGASSELARDGQDLQLQLGEGPSLDGRTAPVHVDDLALDRRWPLAAAGLRALGVHGMSALPIGTGDTAIGSLTAYRVAGDGPASSGWTIAGRAASRHDDLADPTAPHPVDAVADALARAILRSGPLGPSDHAHPDPAADDPFAWLLVDGGGVSAAFHQACGMVAVQIGCDMTEARLRLRARAFAEDRTTLDLARAVVERRVRLEP